MSAALMMKADALADLGRHSDALALCRQRLAQEPEDRWALATAARCALVLNEAALAEDFARALIAAHPDHPYGYAIKAMVADNQHAQHRAETLYRDALKRAPEHPFYYRLLADYFYRWHRKSEAIETAERGLRLDPQDENLLRMLAKLHRETGQLAKAEEYGRLALAADPERAENHIEAAWRDLERGDRKTAMGALRRGLSIAPADKDVHASIVEGQLRYSWIVRPRLGKRSLALLLIAPVVWAAVNKALGGLVPAETAAIVLAFLAQGAFFAVAYLLYSSIDPSLSRPQWLLRVLLALALMTFLLGALLLDLHHWRWLELALVILFFTGLAVSVTFYWLLLVRDLLTPVNRAWLRWRLRSGRL